MAHYTQGCFQETGYFTTQRCDCCCHFRLSSQVASVFRCSSVWSSWLQQNTYGESACHRVGVEFHIRSNNSSCNSSLIYIFFGLFWCSQATAKKRLHKFSCARVLLLQLFFFFDEIDSFAAAEEAAQVARLTGIVSQLLMELDELESLVDVTVVAATNRPDIIDPAIVRPGRLDRMLFVPFITSPR